MVADSPIGNQHTMSKPISCITEIEWPSWNQKVLGACMMQYFTIMGTTLPTSNNISKSHIKVDHSQNVLREPALVVSIWCSQVLGYLCWNVNTVKSAKTSIKKRAELWVWSDWIVSYLSFWLLYVHWTKAADEVDDVVEDLGDCLATMLKSVLGLSICCTLSHNIHKYCQLLIHCEHLGNWLVVNRSKLVWKFLECLAG